MTINPKIYRAPLSAVLQTPDESPDQSLVSYVKYQREPFLFLIPSINTLFWQTPYPGSTFYEDAVGFLTSCEDFLGNDCSRLDSHVKFFYADRYGKKENNVVNDLSDFLENNELMSELLSQVGNSDVGYFLVETLYFSLSWSKTLSSERPRVAVSSERYLGPAIASLIKDTARFDISENLNEVEKIIKLLVNFG